MLHTALPWCLSPERSRRRRQDSLLLLVLRNKPILPTTTLPPLSSSYRGPPSPCVRPSLALHHNNDVLIDDEAAQTMVASNVVTSSWSTHTPAYSKTYVYVQVNNKKRKTRRGRTSRDYDLLNDIRPRTEGFAYVGAFIVQVHAGA